VNDFVAKVEGEGEEIVSARIESISNLGDLVVVFSSRMKAEFVNIT
jgi:hypothetical protein